MELLCRSKPLLDLTLLKDLQRQDKFSRDLLENSTAERAVVARKLRLAALTLDAASQATLKDGRSHKEVIVAPQAIVSEVLAYMHDGRGHFHGFNTNTRTYGTSHQNSTGQV